jgi:hypothetical protein
MTMFVSVFVDEYLKALGKKEKEPPSFKIVPVYYNPTCWLHAEIHSTVSTTAFEGFTSLLFVSNITLMAFESYKQASWQTDLTYVSNIWFTMIFSVEAIVKLYTYGVEQYYAGGWNKFDFFIVTISYGGVIIDHLAAAGLNPLILRIFLINRVSRGFRAFKALKSANGLQKIVLSLVKSLPDLMNLGLMLALVFFIFAVLWNFRNMGEALGILFCIGVAGDAWADVLEVLGRPPANLREAISIHEWQALPPKFHKGAIISLKGMSKAKVKDVFRVCGLKDLIASVGPGLEGLGLPEHMDGRGHQARLKWLFNPTNTGLRLVDLTNHALVLLTLEFPSEVFKSDLNP